MKKVVVLGDTLVKNEPLGIQRFAYEILRELDLIEKEYHCELLIPQDVECKLNFQTINIVRYGKHKGFLWRQIDFPNYVRKHKEIGVDLTLGLPITGCNIVCLYDCIFETYPQDFISTKDKLKRISYLLRAKVNVKYAKKVITVSSYSKWELMRYYKIPENKICVIGNAWQHMNRIVSDDSIITDLELKDKQYCFALGSSLPHKNLKWIVAAAIQNPEMQFVVTGTNRLSSYAQDLNTENLKNVIFTGYLPDGQIKALMKHCYLFIQPSFIEGFGIPPMEALSCGAKILIANSSCLPEIYQKSAYYFDPHDYQNAEIQKLTEGLVDNEKVLGAYSWYKSAHEFHSLICDFVKG